MPGLLRLQPVENYMWRGTIHVGTPAQNFEVDFDTGSSDLFLPGQDCTTNCDGHSKYDPTKSSSAKDLHKTYSVSYGDGTEASGEQWTDIIIFAGYQAGRFYAYRSPYMLTWLTGQWCYRWREQGLLRRARPSPVRCGRHYGNGLPGDIQIQLRVRRRHTAQAVRIREPHLRVPPGQRQPGAHRRAFGQESLRGRHHLHARHR